MGTMRKLFCFKWTRSSLLVGIMILGLIGGCTPLIDIDIVVDNTAGNCPSGGRGGGGGPQLPPGGACTTTNLSSAADANRYNNAKNVATGHAITDHSHMCKAGTVMCASSPGSMACPYPTYKPCKTLYMPDVPPNGLVGTCQCGCP